MLKRSPPTKQWTTLLVFKKHHTARDPSVQPTDTLDHAERAQDGEGERTPVHKGVSLVSEDTKEGPHDGNRCRQVALSGGESVSCGSALEEEESEEHKNLGPDTGMFGERIDTKCLEGSENYQNGGPSVPERERKVHEYFVTRGRRRMLLLDDVVDMRYSAADEERENKGHDVVVRRPEVDVNCVEDTEQGEPP